MNYQAVAEIPEWLALVIVFFLIWGAVLTLLGTIGLARAKTFYERLHMPTLGTTWGVGGIIIASTLYTSIVEDSIILRALLLTAFLLVTTPVTLMLLSRAALHRDHVEDWRQISRERLPHRPDDVVETKPEESEK